MSPEKRLLKAFELSEFVKQLFIYGLKKYIGPFYLILNEDAVKTFGENF